jgi:hypothetical protein
MQEDLMVRLFSEKIRRDIIFSDFQPTMYLEGVVILELLGSAFPLFPGNRDTRGEASCWGAGLYPGELSGERSNK